MRVPPILSAVRRRIRCLQAAAGLALLSLTLTAAAAPTPPLRIALGPLGYEPIPARYLLAGGTMFTVHFADPTHLLVTWSTRGLLKRLADSQPNDQDRNVDAVLLELPSGRVLARTTWRMRDHANYIWPLSHGHFLLRQRDVFSVFSPLENLATSDPFVLHKVLQSQRRIGFVFLSPGADVLTVESLPLIKTDAQLTDEVHVAPRTPVQINFYRVLSPPGEPVTLQYAGLVRADNPVSLPLTGAGYLEPLRDSPQTYNFDFVPYEGKRLELAAFDTSCFPRASFVSRSEFVSFGCRGSDDRQQMGFFNLKGEHPWLSTFSSQYVNPFLVTAPDASRFALGRTLVSSAGLDLDNLTDAEVTGQEITAFQDEDGRTLLKVMATPVQRAGQNFDLSSDGLSLAVIHDGNLEVYVLPALTKKDKQDIEAAGKWAPQGYTGQVRIAAEDRAGDGAAAEVAEPLSPQPKAINNPNNTVGDATNDPEGPPRKPPSLYGPGYPKEP